jgi:hypothetical protein
MIALNYYLITKVIAISITYVCAYLLGACNEKYKNMIMKIEICEKDHV